MEHKQFYKIDNIHRNISFIHPETGKPGQRKISSPTEHEFDVPNDDLYDEAGQLLQSKDSGKYDLIFCHKLAKIKPVERVADFLDYQYAHCPDKIAFVKHINTGAIINSYDLSNSPSRQEGLIRWIKGKQGVLDIPEELNRIWASKTETREGIAQEQIDWFTQQYKRIKAQHLKEQFLRQEIERTTRALSFLLANAETLEGNLEYYDGGNLYLEHLENIQKNGSEERINSEVTKSDRKDKLTHKQQILLLKSLGFFDLPVVQGLSTSNKGILLSYLLNRDEKNSGDYFRYLDAKKIEPKFNCRTSQNLKKLKEVFKMLGLNEPPL